ncbi:CYTH domain-containing protein [Lederbergia citrea]|uniref:CYTH domain-containing protein n=1 Tax=Lederbergia citrea TaxID=2833581 RepID=UPI00201612C8|nr:CYTH domain-containing protein [Lederbergia citrea]
MIPVSRDIEIEFKNIVTKAEFQLLLHTFNISSSQFFNQKNHYFDTVNFALKNVNTALRVRELPRGFELTLKKPAKVGLLEINQPLSNVESNLLLANSIFPDGEVADEIEAMNIDVKTLELFGSLTTTRAETKYKNGLLVFDHSFYLGQEDFEIEYETIDWDIGQETFNHLLEELNIDRRPADSKIGRLYHAKIG